MTTFDVPRPRDRVRAPRLPVRARARTSAGALLLAAWMLAGCSSDDPLMSTAKPWWTLYTGFEIHVTDEQGGAAVNVPVEVTVMSQSPGLAARVESGVTDAGGRFRRPLVPLLRISYRGHGGSFTSLEVSPGPPSGNPGEAVVILDSLWVVDTPGEVVVSIFEVTLP